MSDIRAVLFDLDGVLVDATEWHYEALNRALRLFGFGITRYEHLAGYNGLPTRRKLEMLSVEKGLPVALHGMVGRLKQVYNATRSSPSAARSSRRNTCCTGWRPRATGSPAARARSARRSS
jgi:beta-phosphoglucomutase-like phosphatase (HAD superfamily)